MLPLRLAVIWRHVDVVRVLLNAGADPSSAIDDVSCGAPKVIQLLLERGADPNYTGEYRSNPGPLTQTVVQGPADSKLVRKCLQSAALLIKYGAKTSGVPSNSQMPLIAAVDAHSVPFLELLLSKGANVNAVNIAGLTPLMEAVRLHADEVDCPKRFDNVCGNAPYLQMIRVLLDHGANPNLRDKDRWNALFANRYPYLSGSTPLCIAARYGWIDVAKLLLAHGANPSIPRSDGATPLAIARGARHLGTAAVIAKSIQPPRKPEPANHVAASGVIKLQPVGKRIEQ
ncbi:MAG TPA: ankyrin repeat domain-containing protein [Steroidobacteraceae bacterium]|nr:ankyrin repeat domain-containing protein [Steroidobacteraceae bacterium]